MWTLHKNETYKTRYYKLPKFDMPTEPHTLEMKVSYTVHGAKFDIHIFTIDAKKNAPVGALHRVTQACVVTLAQSFRALCSSVTRKRGRTSRAIILPSIL